MFLCCVTDSGTTHVCLHQGWIAMGTTLPVFVPPEEVSAFLETLCTRYLLMLSARDRSLSSLFSFQELLDGMMTKLVAANSHSSSASFHYAAVPSITQPPSRRNFLRRLSPATEAEDISDKLSDTCGYVSGNPGTLMTSQLTASTLSRLDCTVYAWHMRLGG